jgi:hypothetical protein
MAMSRKEPRGVRAFAFPLFGIAALLLAYWLLSDWQHLPDIVGSAVGAMHWPP